MAACQFEHTDLLLIFFKYFPKSLGCLNIAVLLTNSQMIADVVEFRFNLADRVINTCFKLIFLFSAPLLLAFDDSIPDFRRELHSSKIVP